MHDEKNQKESAVITVASKRNSKEGRKTMENKSLNINDESSKKRTKLTVHKVAKGVNGITLIALVVTIIALLILAGVAINLTIGDNGIITRAQKARLTSELSTYKEELEMYEVGKELDNTGFMRDTLTAGKTKLNYNTQPEGEKGNIKTIINSISDEYLEKLEVIKGELLINTKDINEIKIAQSLGIEVNPYDITEEGELLSSYGNLLLMSEDGTLTIPERVTKIGEGAFSNLEGLKTIIIPGTCKEIAQNAFRNNPTLEHVIMEDGVEKIGAYAFFRCTNLISIEMPDSITEVGNECFRYDTKLENVKLSNNLITLNGYVFGECTNLKNIELPENLEQISNQCFSGTNIIEIKLPKNLQTLSSGSSLPQKLQTIDTSENNYFEFKNGILYTKDLKTLVFALSNITSVNMEESVETISSAAFEKCSYLTSINLTSKVRSIGESAFNNSKLSRITVSSGNNYFSVDERYNLYNKDKTVLYRNFDKGNITIKDGVQNIKRGAFINDGTITGITLPESYVGDTTTGWGTFPPINYIKLPKNVKNINKYAYYDIKSIEVSTDNLYLNSINNEYILSEDGTELYWVKSDLIDVQIPNTVKTIKQNALMITKAENIVLPSSIEKIEGGIISYSTSIKKIEIQSNIKQIDTNAFSNASNLFEIIIHKEAGSISGSPWGCTIGNKAVSWIGE